MRTNVSVIITLLFGFALMMLFGCSTHTVQLATPTSAATDTPLSTASTPAVTDTPLSTTSTPTISNKPSSTPRISIFDSNPLPTTEVDRTRDTYWVVGRSGVVSIAQNGQSTPDSISIQTNDYPRLQNELPFNVIFPSYIPLDVQGYPRFSALRYPIDSPEVQVTFQYDSQSASYNGIDITETNSTSRWFDENGTYLDATDIYSNKHRFFTPWSEDLNHYTRWEHNGILFIISTSVNQGLLQSENIQVVSYNYEWYANDLHFQVSVAGYDQSEAIKIIDSMFK